MITIEEITQQFDLRKDEFLHLPNDEDQLVWGAAHLATGTFACPKGWDKVYWRSLCDKLYPARLAIAGVMLAVEIERIKQLKLKKS